MSSPRPTGWRAAHRLATGCLGGHPYTAAMALDAVQGRILGSLVEKELATPQQYPLTANALLLACNQTSNREPVMLLTESEVQQALDQLKGERLVRFVFPSHGRSVIRYRHVLDEALGLEEQQRALLGVLLLRGPQTVGELRARTERLAAFDRLQDVEVELDALAARSEPLVERLPRRPGQKEERYRQLLAAEGTGAGAGVLGDGGFASPTATAATAGGPPPGPAAGGAPGAGPAPGASTAPGPGAVVPAAGPGLPGPDAGHDGWATAGPDGMAALRFALDQLRADVTGLTAQVTALQGELRALRDSLGG